MLKVLLLEYGCSRHRVHVSYLGSTARLADGVVYGFGVITLERSGFRLRVYINCCLSKRVGGGGSLQPQRHIPLPLKSQMKMDNLNAKEM